MVTDLASVTGSREAWWIRYVAGLWFLYRRGVEIDHPLRRRWWGRLMLWHFGEKTGKIVVQYGDGVWSREA